MNGNYLEIKLKAIDNISAVGMRVTLQVTVINTVNNDAVGSIVQFAAENSVRRSLAFSSNPLCLQGATSR